MERSLCLAQYEKRTATGTGMRLFGAYVFARKCSRTGGSILMADLDIGAVFDTAPRRALMGTIRGIRTGPSLVRSIGIRLRERRFGVQMATRGKRFCERGTCYNAEVPPKWVPPPFLSRLPLDSLHREIVAYRSTLCPDTCGSDSSDIQLGIYLSHSQSCPTN